MDKARSGIIDIEAAKAASVVEFNRENYGQIIRTRRAELGITQQQLADSLHIAKNYVSHWETGRARPDLNIVPMLCRALKITIAEFFGNPGSLSEMSFAQQCHMRNYNLLKPSDRDLIDNTINYMLDSSTAPAIW